MAVKCILTGQTPSVLDGVEQNVQDQLDSKANKSRILTLSVPTASWTGDGPFTQVVTIDGGTTNTLANIQADTTLLNQMMADGTTNIHIENEDGVFTAYAIDAKPSVDLSIQIECSESISV